MKMPITDKNIAKHLIEFYSLSGRLLPWREDKDPYKVHGSETMLQQTRVETVIPYFKRFLSHFPTLYSLAEAKEEEVLKLWEGLGYYSRAKNLQKAAKMIVFDYQGKYPDSLEGLLSLPGVGEYTAKAILTFCFDLPFVPIDGNFLRLFSRLTGYKENVLVRKAKKEAEEFFLSLLGQESPSLFGQAAMELGELICLPNATPKCEGCPLSDSCYAYNHEQTSSLPVRLVPNKKKEERKTALVYGYKGEYGYLKRPSSGLLANLYGFPLLEGHLSKARLMEKMLEEGIQVSRIIPLTGYIHSFSHVKWDMKAFLLELIEKPKAIQEKEELIFLSLEKRRDAFPLPSAFLPLEKQLR